MNTNKSNHVDSYPIFVTPTSSHGVTAQKTLNYLLFNNSENISPGYELLHREKKILNKHFSYVFGDYFVQMKNSANFTYSLAEDISIYAE